MGSRIQACVAMKFVDDDDDDDDDDDGIEVGDPE